MKFGSLVCAVALSVSLGPNRSLAEDDGQQAIERGEYLFKGACGAYCHSTTPELRDAPYLFDCEWLHGGSDDAIFKVIFEGVPNTRMPAFADLLPKGERDINQIIAFLKAKQPSC
jgi:mono/diheme cytochrome c family protein